MNLECAMERRARRPPPPKTREAEAEATAAAAASTKGKGSMAAAAGGGRKVEEYERTLSSRRLLEVGSGYLSLQYLYLLVGLTASLLILPLVLPPLPPPPSFLLLLLPICILACLMFLAFTPSNSKDLTHV